jgi:hypothetical protein
MKIDAIPNRQYNVYFSQLFLLDTSDSLKYFNFNCNYYTTI